MILADVFLWFLVILGSYIVINAYWLTTEGLAPGLVDACAAAYRRPVRRILLGGAAALVLGGVGTVLSRLPFPPAKLVGVTILLVLLLAALVGSAGLARRVGLGLTPATDAPWRATFRGGAVLGLTFVLPLLGWFIVLPLVLVSGLGAVIVAGLAAHHATKANTAPPASGASVAA